MRTIAAVMMALVLGLSICFAHQVSQTGGQEIEFAVPSQGLVTLGVFDKAGKLVRLLHALDDEDAFRIGDNGYVTQWDGCDDSGRKMPPGRYFVRGFLVGDVTVEGEAFHFNEWVTSAESPAPRRIEDFAILPGRDLIITGRLQGGKAFCGRYSAASGFLWTREFDAIEGRKSALAVTNDAAMIFQQRWQAFALADGANAKVPAELADAAPVTLSASADRVVFSNGDMVKSISPAEEVSTVIAPESFTAISASELALAGLAGGNLWIDQNRAQFEKIPLPANVTSLAFGEGRTLWFTGASMDPDASTIVAQANFEGGILRALVPAPGDPLPVLVRASRTSDVFGILEESKGLQRLRVLSRNPEGGWTVEWEKTIHDAPDFGFVQGQVASNALASPQDASLRFRLDENPLTGKREEVTLQAAFGPEGVQLTTANGLPVATVSHSPDIQRVTIQRGTAPDSLRLLQGNGAVVEEYLVQGLRHITPLAAGEVLISK